MSSINDVQGKSILLRMLVQNGKNKRESVPNCIRERNKVQTFGPFIVNITKWLNTHIFTFG